MASFQNVMCCFDVYYLNPLHIHYHVSCDLSNTVSGSEPLLRFNTDSVLSREQNEFKAKSVS